MRKAFIALLLPALALTACKPTERNYQTAYDKAYEAAQRRAEGLTTGAGGERLESLDGPRLQMVDGDTLRIATAEVKRFESGEDLTDSGNVGVAVARYSMPTNARRHLADLREDFREAFIATDGDDNYYVVAFTAPSIEEAAAPLRTFRNSNPSFPFIGLPDGPLLLFISK